MAERRCAECETVFSSGYPQAKYCSKRCGQRVRSRRQVQSGYNARKIAAQTVERECVGCGRSFTVARRSSRRRCEGCQPLVGRRAVSHVLWRQCWNCGRSFTTKGGRRCACPRVADTWVRRGTTLTGECAECGCTFTFESTTRRLVLCGADCRKARAKRKRRAIKRDWGKNDRQRARHFGVEYEPIRRPLVYERDRWRCGICGDKIDRKSKAPHPKSASLDHIIPMSLGGSHTYSNVQCAHFECNWRKSVGTTEHGEQLRLVG